MKNFLFTLQVILFMTFGFLLFLSVTEITKSASPFEKFNHSIPIYDGIEEFDPSLARLSSMEKLGQYCDSLYISRFGSTAGFTEDNKYPEVVNEVIRKRFYHGYSMYSFTDNYMALLLEPLFINKLVSAIVIPDDMMKFPYAACSQQSIICMELLKSRGFTTRMVGLGGAQFGGHFCFETYYEGEWHFFDPNREPNMSVIDEYRQPSIEILAKNDNLLLSAFTRMEPARVLGLYKNYFYGKPNVFEAPNALIYQKTTKYLSYISWIFPLIVLLFVRRRYLRLSFSTDVWNSRIYLPRFNRRRSPAYYPEPSA